MYIQNYNLKLLIINTIIQLPGNVDNNNKKKMMNKIWIPLSKKNKNEFIRYFNIYFKYRNEFNI